MKELKIFMNNKRPRPVFLLLLLFTVAAPTARAQDTTLIAGPPQNWKVTLNVETGYTTFALGDAHALFNQILTAYRQRDVPLPSQTTFPGNLLIGGSVMFNSPIPFGVGIGGYYSRTAAISTYNDYSGTLLERMDVNLVTFYMTIELNPLADFRPFYICAHPGVGYSRVNYVENLDMTYPTAQSSSNTLSAYGLVIAGDAGIGLNFSLLKLPVSIEADYREGKITRLTDVNGLLQVPLDISGFVFKTRIGIGI